MNKKIKMFFLFVFAPVCAFSAAREQADYKPFSSEFYQNFISAAWQQKNGNDAEALALYLQLDGVLPKDPAIVKSIIEIAIDKEDTQTMDKYVPILMEAAPQEASTLSIYATWLWSKGRFNEALSYYRQAIDKDPEDPEIIFKYVTLLTSIDSDKAIAFLQELSAKYPKMAGLISVQVADLYIAASDFNGAETYLKEAQQKTPYLKEPYLALAKIYESQGKPDAALNEYLKMEEIGLADSDTLTKIGAYMVLKKEKDLSLEYFLKAKQADNGNPFVARFLVLDAEDKQDYSLALKYIKDSRDFDTTPSYWIRASYFLNRMGDMQASADILKEAYKKFDNNMEIAFYYALSLIDLRDYKQARKIIESILSSAPNNEATLFQYAFVLEKQKEYKKMQENLLKVLEINPKHANALNFLGYYLVDKTNKTQEGGNYIKQAIALDPKDPAFIDSLAWYYYKSGETDKALDLLKSIDEKDAADPEISLHLAVVYEAEKDYKKAAQYYKVVADAEPENKDAKNNVKRMEEKIILK